MLYHLTSLNLPSSIVNFFALMGKIFVFVSSDVSDKVRIIDEHCTGEKGEEYKVIEEVLR